MLFYPFVCSSCRPLLLPPRPLTLNSRVLRFVSFGFFGGVGRAQVGAYQTAQYVAAPTRNPVAAKSASANAAAAAAIAASAYASQTYGQQPASTPNIPAANAAVTRKNI